MEKTIEPIKHGKTWIHMEIELSKTKEKMAR